MREKTISLPNLDGLPLYARTPKRKPSGKPNGTSLNAGVLVTRRRFLYGVAGLCAAGVVAGGVAVASNIKEHQAAKEVNAVSIPVDAVTSSDNCKETKASASLSKTGSYKLDFGTLVWANDDNVAACLLPSDSADPLTKIGLLSLASGNCAVVRKKAVGHKSGFEIYDVRATSEAIIWTEANILDGIWRLYTATVKGSEIGKPVLVEEGNGDWETPCIAAAASYVYWQMIPQLEGPKKTEPSVLKKAAAGSKDSSVAYTSPGRMATPPYPLSDGIVITPRVDEDNSNYQLTLLSLDNDKVLDTMVLPSGMKPLEAGYGPTGFTFSFDAIYNFGDGISNLGTYAPKQKPSDGNYGSVPWFCFGRTPTAAPAWCSDHFMVKSTSAVCGVNLSADEYFALSVDSGADDYGDYLATTGQHDRIVTYSNVDYTSIEGDNSKYCRVRVWEPKNSKPNKKKASDSNSSDDSTDATNATDANATANDEGSYPSDSSSEPTYSNAAEGDLSA